MAIHPDGTIWASGPGSARRLNPVTKEWSSWDTPTWLKTKKNPGGYGLTIDGDGRAWMAMNLVDRMARFDGKTGEVVEFKVPGRRHVLSAPHGHRCQRRCLGRTVGLGPAA